MKKTSHHFVLTIALLILVCFCACSNDNQPNCDYSNTNNISQETTLDADSQMHTSTMPVIDESEPDIDVTNFNDAESAEYEIAALNGTVRIPNGYYVFDENNLYTDQMCFDIGVDPANMENAIPMLQGQTLIVPSDEPYSESPHIYIKVKEKKYEDITLSELSLNEFDLIASTVVSSFGVDDYEMVEANGLRFFVFIANQGLGNVCRYATILNGHMVYVYEDTGDKDITEEQRSDLEFIALSIHHGL